MTVMVHLTPTGKVLRAAWGTSTAAPVIDLPDGTRVTLKDEASFEWCTKCHRMMGDHAFDCPSSNQELDGA